MTDFAFPGVVKTGVRLAPDELRERKRTESHSAAAEEVSSGKIVAVKW